MSTTIRMPDEMKKMYERYGIGEPMMVRKPKRRRCKYCNSLQEPDAVKCPSCGAGA